MRTKYLAKIGSTPLPIDQVMKWAEQLCDVLNYLHSHQPPIVFRDLKPANIMIGDNGHIINFDNKLLIFLAITLLIRDALL